MAISVHMNAVKSYATWLIIICVLAFAGWQAYQYINDYRHPRVPLTISGTTFDVKVAATESVRHKGLSGTKHLDLTEGMLFVFERDDKWGIWMKDMFIPIDILWLDKDKKIIYIVKQADPSSYPFTTYSPSKPARYVVELAAGTVARKNLKIGDVATFDLSSLEEGGIK